jgi:branched-chain amino acid aminotransferase
MSTTCDWKNLGFQYMDTGKFIKVEYVNGSWQAITRCTNPVIPLHVAATCLHYGQSCFEGLKAFTRKDGTVATFRPLENAQRLADSALRLCMIPPPPGLFLEAVNEAIKINRDYVPPYGTGASLYIRPLLIGSSPHVGVHPSEEYHLYVLVMPVGPYYKHGFFPVKAIVMNSYDRAAPRGVGNIKAAGNYAAGMMGDRESKGQNYPIALYLDSATHGYIDEFGTSNFIGITADKRYVTPKSSSILPSITNKSLQALAQDFGLTVEHRPIAVAELPDFIEVGACGTAAVITPIYSITHDSRVYTYGKEHEAGVTLTKLFRELQAIQYGEIEDRHEWMAPVD